MEKVLRVLYFVIPVQVFLLIIAGLVWMGLETTEEVISMPDFMGCCDWNHNIPGRDSSHHCSYVVCFSP